MPALRTPRLSPLADTVRAVDPGERLYAETGTAQRAKAFACTAPLHDLETRKSSYQRADFTVYLMAELAMHAIDVVTLSMDIQTGIGPGDVLADLATFASRQAPERAEAEHQAVAGWVLDALLNVGTPDRGFRVIYGRVTEDTAEHTRHEFDFKLLEEVLGPDGEIFLRATNEAINVLIGALDLDIESAQIAADHRLNTLIARGRLTDAAVTAQQARRYTAAYSQRLREQMDATRRDVRHVDWETEMPKLLADALTHIEERQRVEHAILKNITDVRDQADDPVKKKQAAELVMIVSDCLARHGRLVRELRVAEREFRDEQDRQAFTPGPAQLTVDLHAQLLLPALLLTSGQLDAPAFTFVGNLLGARSGSAVNLEHLYSSLITPSAERDLLGGEIVDPDLSDSVDEAAFPDECYQHLERLLELDPDAPARLSGLLEQARELHPQLPLLVVIEVLARAAEEIQAAVRAGAQHVLIAYDDGTALDDAEFAGTDLVVTRARLDATGTAGKPLAHDTTDEAALDSASGSVTTLKHPRLQLPAAATAKRVSPSSLPAPFVAVAALPSLGWQEAAGHVAEAPPVSTDPSSVPTSAAGAR